MGLTDTVSLLLIPGEEMSTCYSVIISGRNARKCISIANVHFHTALQAMPGVSQRHKTYTLPVSGGPPDNKRREWTGIYFGYSLVAHSSALVNTTSS